MLLVEVRTSSFEPSGLKRRTDCLNESALAADGAVETRVADRLIDPAVEAEPHVARTGVRVAGPPAGEQDLADVGLVVAVGVLEEERVGGLGDDQAAVDVDHAGGDAQLVGEDRELVGLAVAVGILADLDPVAPLARGLHARWDSRPSRRSRRGRGRPS